MMKVVFCLGVMMPLNKAQLAVDKIHDLEFLPRKKMWKTFLAIRISKVRPSNGKDAYIAPDINVPRHIWKDPDKIKLNWIKRTNEQIGDTTGKWFAYSVVSGDNPDALRGAGWDIVIHDEVPDLKPVMYEAIRPSCCTKAFLHYSGHRKVN